MPKQITCRDCGDHCFWANSHAGKPVLMNTGPDPDGGRFVLMPTAAPLGRTITAQTLANYRTMVRLGSA